MRTNIIKIVLFENFSELRGKNISSHDGDHITYREVQKYAFNEEASGNNTEGDIVTMLNPALTVKLVAER